MCKEAISPLARYPASHVYCITVPFVIFAQTHVEMNLQSMILEISFGFVADFHRQRMALFSGSTGLGSFPKHNFDAVRYGHQSYTIECRHVEQSSSIHEQIGRVWSFGKSEHNSTFSPLCHIPLFMPVNELFTYSRTTYPVHVYAMIKQHYFRLE